MDLNQNSNERRNEMTALAAIHEREEVKMATPAEVVMVGERIVRVNILPTGSDMEEALMCEDICYDFLAHQHPVSYMIEDGIGNSQRRMIFSCHSGEFLFPVRYEGGSGCDNETLDKLSLQIRSGSFCLMKNGYGFSLNV